MKGEKRKHLLTVRDTGGGPINDDTLRPAAAAAVETGADIDPLSAVHTAPLYTVLFCTVLCCMLYIHTTPVVLVHSTTQHRPASTRSVHQCQWYRARLRWYGPHLNMLGMYTGLCHLNMMVSSGGYSNAIH